MPGTIYNTFKKTCDNCAMTAVKLVTLAAFDFRGSVSYIILTPLIVKFLLAELNTLK